MTDDSSTSESSTIPTTTPSGSEVDATTDKSPEIIGVRQGSFGAPDGSDVSGFGGLVEPIVMPGAATRPYGGWFDAFADELEASLQARDIPASAIERVVIQHQQLTFHVGRDYLVEFVRTLRDEPALRFEQNCGVAGVHYPNQTGKELHCVYPFYSITHNRRIIVETTCPDHDRTMPSIVSVYPGNDWHEREAWDMFGIIFVGHPYLTRILMPDDWVGHPQRKDYSLDGIPVEYKGATIPPPNERRAYN